MELDKLTIEQEIGQLFAVSIPLTATPEQLEMACRLINKYSIGSVLLDQKGLLKTQAHIVNTINEQCPHHPLILQDLEWGLTMRLHDGVPFPRAMTCGAIQDDKLIYEMGKEIGRECKLIGVDINLAPVLDINSNPNNPVINDRSFGENKENVTRKGLAYIRGLVAHGIISCGKHAPGHGDTSVDSHLDLPVIQHSQKRIFDIELYPFAQCAPLLQCMMSAHISIPSLDPQTLCTTLSKKIITGILRDELQFQGVIITDALRMKALSKYLSTSEITLGAFEAGNDLLLCPDDIETAIATIMTATHKGIITEEEIKKRIARIMTLKKRVRAKLNHKTLRDQIHTSSAYNLKNQLFESATTLVQNEESLVPISSDDKAAIVQIGGNMPSEFTKKLTCIRSANYLSSTPDWIDLENLIKTTENDEKIIVGLFEITKANAQIENRKFDSQNFGIAPATLELIRRLQERGKKVILAVFGTPYSLKHFEEVPTIIMAYEDDPDAQKAAAKIITGELTAKGKLPVSVSEKFPEGLGL